MWKKTLIQTQTDDSAQKMFLERLNKHFKTEPFEKHPEAMINIILDKIMNEVVDFEYHKRTFSKRKLKRIYDLFLDKIQCKYGKWVNVSNFKAVGVNLKFQSNFKGVFQNAKGRLYGSYSPEDLFITSHCLERFEERLDTDKYKTYFYTTIERLKRIFKSEPTALDILRDMFLTAEPEYAKGRESNIFYNVRTGVLVLQKIDDIFIALTFLTYEMMEDKMTQWKKVLIPENEKYDSITELLNNETSNIKLIDTDKEEL